MSMDATTFSNRVGLTFSMFRAYSNLASEANAVRVGLGADTTTRDTTLQTAPVGLQPANAGQTPFTNALVQEVNKGKAGNLGNISMANLIGGAIPVAPPTNTVAPTIALQTPSPGGDGVGALYINGSVGTWQPTGNTIARQWLRGGANIPGATGVTYTTVAADVGQNISLAMTQTNASGSLTAYSNSILNS